MHGAAPAPAGPARAPKRAPARLAAGLLLAAASGVAGHARAGDVLPGLDLPAAAAAPVLDPAPAALGPAGPALALLDVAPRLEALPARLRPGPAEPVALTSPIVSGLPWRSGAKCDDCAGFGTWRGRPVDVVMLYVDHGTWDAMAAFLAKPYYKRRLKDAPQPVVSLPMLPDSEFKQHAACATGAFDAYFRQFGALLVQAGGGQAVVRLGWESNVGSTSHAWGVDTAAEIPGYIACFQHEAAALRSTAPGIRIEWSSSKRSWAHVNTLSFYPGDSYVDLWGVHYYDTDPEKSTQAVWDRYYDATLYGGPWGLGTWIRAAVADGKKLAVPEWGVWQQSRNPQPDDPVYVANMYATFKANATAIEYESYFDVGTAHQLYPTTRFPNAASSYKALWSAGQ